MDVNAVLALLAIGAVLGALLGFANKYLHVEEDERITVVTEKLPNPAGFNKFSTCSISSGLSKHGGTSTIGAPLNMSLLEFLNPEKCVPAMG